MKFRIGSIYHQAKEWISIIRQFFIHLTFPYGTKIRRLLNINVRDDKMEQNTLKIVDIHSLSDAVDITARRFQAETWWRGQAQRWPLLPGIYREGICSPIYSDRCERDMCTRFLLGASQRHTKWTDGDHPHTLAVMQHYGLPTRLLDWTESPLFAALFALLDPHQDGQDGVLWALCPSLLNQAEQGKSGLLSPYSNPEIMLLFKAPFGILEDNQLSIIKNAAVIIRQVDIRMTVQLSAFTIQGRPNPLDQSAQAEGYLLEFPIPKEKKDDLRRELFRLGIRESNIFPDLEHLAKEIKEWGGRENYVEQYSAPDSKERG